MTKVEINMLTRNENKVLNRKLSGKRLTQVESNYLSRAIRPKLRKLQEMKVDIDSILQKIQYNQKARSIELKLEKIISSLIKQVDSITLYGSAIQTNYYSYNDIDVLILTKKKVWKTPKEKYALIREIKKQTDLSLDIQIMDKKSFYAEYPSSPSLIYQLKDSKTIYGKLKLPSKIKLYNIDLQMKLDWSDIEDIEPEGIDIYKAIRNIFLVRLLLNKIIDNQKLNESMNNEIGKNLIEKLRNNKESKIERKIALNYLKELIEKTTREIKGGLWEKIELSGY